MVRDDSSQPEKVTVIGRTGSPACYAIRDCLYRNDAPFQWVELRDDAQARALGLDRASDERLPVCGFPDGTRLERPPIRRLAEQLGLSRDPSHVEYDLAIYGAGPAGLSAAPPVAGSGPAAETPEATVAWCPRELNAREGTAGRTRSASQAPSDASAVETATHAVAIQYSANTSSV
jgi:hypothetical protein